MPRRPVLLAILLALVAGGFALRQATRDGGPARHTETEAEMGRELNEPADALLARVAYGSDGSNLSSLYRKAIAQQHRLAARTAQVAPKTAATEWNLVGPTNIGGRLLDVAVDPRKPNTVWIAAAGGGVWRSTEKGEKLQPAWPHDLPQAVGALAITPSGTVYAGTGETGPGGGSLTYGGTGIYRSDDDGKTWRSIGLENTSRISRIVLDPSNPRRIFVAASGNLFKGSNDRGVFRSEDGGDTWKRVLAGDNDITGAADIAIDPKNPKRMLATMWQHQRLPDRRNYTGLGSGVYRSTDGGDSWERVGVPLLGPNPILGRMGVAIDPQQPDTVYVIAAGTPIGGAHLGFYKSTNFGDTFTLLIDPDQATLDGALTYGWWFGRIWVDPKISTRVYVAGVSLLKSDDGGASFTPDATVHADQHGMSWDPRVPGRVYLGNDGGLYRSDDNGASWTHMKYQPYSQPDSLDVSEQDPKFVVAGLQDNGVIMSDPRGPDREWVQYVGGDGERSLINPQDKETYYGCSQNGACTRVKNNQRMDFSNSYISTRHNFFTPIEFDPVNPKTLYIGGDILSRSDDEAETWRPISPNLDNGLGGETNPLYIDYGTLTTISPAPSSTGTIYAGTDDGNLWYTHSGGGPTGWTKANDPDLPKAWITRVQVDPRDPKVAYVTYSGMRAGQKAAYVLRTRDGGESWNSITGDLPKIQVSDINVVDDKLVVATDVGVFASRDQGSHWYVVGANLPLSPSYELRVHRPSNQLYVATFGRSIWKVDLSALEGLPGAKRKRYTLGLPKRRSCKRTTLRFRVRQKGVSLRSARVYVGKRRVATLSGRRLKRTLRIRLPRGRARVKITAVTRSGEKISATRTYAACKKKRARRR